MKTILLPFYDDDAAEAALDVSRRLGARFGSYVEGLFVMRPPADHRRGGNRPCRFVPDAAQGGRPAARRSSEGAVRRLRRRARVDDRIADRAHRRHGDRLAGDGRTRGSGGRRPRPGIRSRRDRPRIRASLGGLARHGGGGAVRERPPDRHRARRAGGHSRRERRHRLEPQHGNGAHGGACDAVARGSTHRHRRRGQGVGASPVRTRISSVGISSATASPPVRAPSRPTAGPREKRSSTNAPRSVRTSW